MSRDSFVIGVDFGTDSVRSVVVDAYDGKEISSAVFHYPRWRDGLYCDATVNQFRQHPLDYIEGLNYTIAKCLRDAGAGVAGNVRAISVDTTGSTPVAVDRRGIPLAMKPGFESNPDAMFVLWKDHSSTDEAAEINGHAKRFDTNYLRYVGGIYSSEWFWAKLLHVLRKDEHVRKECFSWVEHCDWVPFLLTGGSDASKISRSVCAAGHKALWAREFGGLPPRDFFHSLDPLLSSVASTFPNGTYTSDRAAGQISAGWAERLGLKREVIVGIGAFDCHMGAVGGQIEPYHLSKVMGTSTCDMMVISREDMGDRLVRGICGQVDGSILPGMIGLEAGQSAFGDTYAWYKDLLSWPLQKLLQDSSLVSGDLAGKLSDEIGEKIIPALSVEASKLPLDENAEVAVDWLNGRRTPDADQRLTGGVMGLSLGSDAPRLFRAWVEATCFGARAITDRIMDEGLAIKGLIGLGGVARKSSYIMQVLANVMNKSIRIHRSDQTCALGAAMFAATISGLYPTVTEAMNAMGHGFDREFQPDPAAAAIYNVRYKRYRDFGATMDKHKGKHQ